METSKFYDDELIELIQEYEMDRNCVNSDLEQWLWDIDQENLDQIDSQIHYLKSSLLCLDGSIMDLHYYLEDNEQKIINNIENETLKEKI